MSAQSPGLAADSTLALRRRRAPTPALASAAAATLVTAAALVLVLAPGPARQAAAPTPAAPAPAHSGWGAVPTAARLAISRAIGADQPAFEVHNGVARNAPQGLALRFSPAGVSVSANGGSAVLGLRATPVTPTVSRNRVSYDHGAITE